jgi:hypothetical protein
MRIKSKRTVSYKLKLGRKGIKSSGLFIRNIKSMRLKTERTVPKEIDTCKKRYKIEYSGPLEIEYA